MFYTQLPDDETTTGSKVEATRPGQVPTALLLVGHKYDCKLPRKIQTCSPLANKKAKITPVSRSIRKTPAKKPSPSREKYFSDVFTQFLVSDVRVQHMLQLESEAFCRFLKDSPAPDRVFTSCMAQSLRILTYIIKVLRNVGVGHVTSNKNSQSSLEHPALNLVKETSDMSVSDFCRAFRKDIPCDHDFGYSLTLERVWYLTQCALSVKGCEAMRTSLETSVELDGQSDEELHPILKKYV